MMRAPESPTRAADSYRAQRKERTRRLFSGGLKDIGIGALLTVGAAITAGLGAPVVGLGLLIAGFAVGTYGVLKSAVGVGSGVTNTVFGV